MKFLTAKSYAEALHLFGEHPAPEMVELELLIPGTDYDRIKDDIRFWILDPQPPVAPLIHLRAGPEAWRMDPSISWSYLRRDGPE